MPIKHAAIKDLRKNKRRAARNERTKQNVRFLLKKAENLLKESKGKETAAIVSALQQAIDKAAKVGVMSKSKASRKKSSVMKALHKK